MTRINGIQQAGHVRLARASRGRTERFQRRGFTIIEMVIVLVVAGFLMALAVPKIDFILMKYRADAAAQLIRSTLQQAQRNSLVRQYDVVVSFDTAGGRIRVLQDVNNNGAIDVGETVNTKSFEDGSHYAAPPTALAGFGTKVIDGPTIKTLTAYPTVTFHRDGSASSDFTVYLTSARTTLTDFRAITVTQGTGRMDWYRYDGTAWQRAGF
jgi:prepilin-type N-terminal cleavage/methylation domain-containing protein